MGDGPCFGRRGDRGMDWGDGIRRAYQGVLLRGSCIPFAREPRPVKRKRAAASCQRRWTSRLRRGSGCLRPVGLSWREMNLSRLGWGERLERSDAEEQEQICGLKVLVSRLAFFVWI